MSFLEEVDEQTIDRRVGCKLCALLDAAGMRKDVDKAFAAGKPVAPIHRALVKRGIEVGRSTVERHANQEHWRG